MKYVLLLAGFLATPAFADVIICSQAEPFITETFDTEAGTLNVQTPQSTTKVYTGIKFVLTGVNTFEFRDAKGKVLRQITVNYKGSNGMSDATFPLDGGQGANGSIACSSSELKPIGG